MELLCPECRAPLQVANKRAHCPTHGGDFEVLFLREEVKAPQTVLSSSPLLPSLPSSSLEPAAAPATTMRCVQHPSVPATQQCQLCGAYVCSTCDFALPTGMHLCPSCATKPQTSLSPRRRKSMIWGFVLAGFSSAGLIGTMAIAAVRAPASTLDQNALGTLMVFVVLLPAIVGLGMSLGAIDRRYYNPVSLWIATIWNGLILSLFLLLSIIGTMH